jgi:thioester reductase-like protein
MGVHEGATASTLAAVLDARAEAHPERVVYTFLRDGEVESGNLTFRELRQRSMLLAARLTRLNTAGQRAILLYPQGLEFIIAFFACLYAGVIAVPVSLPNRKKGLEVLHRIAADSGATWILSTGTLLDQLSTDIAVDPVLGAISCIDTELWVEPQLDGWVRPSLGSEMLALLQYTSGSTGTPRGVAVTHANLVANHRQLEQSFGHDENTIIVSWLPMFHDMGLGTVLGAVWLGGRCILMSPQAFLQNPKRWLWAISDYRATSSGGPDFAYDLCARRVTAQDIHKLDLSSWRVAYNGSEPVRASTLDRFAQAFAPFGFRREAFHPVYGLAECTLFVTSEAPSEAPVVEVFSSRGLELSRAEPAPSARGGSALVSCGHPWAGTEVAVVNPETREEQAVGQVGEIWIRGVAVAAGYWGKEVETEEAFHATTADGKGPFLRSGDLGFVWDGRLFVTGRYKDLIIVRGLNHYPQDIEDTVSYSHSSLVPHACAAFSVDGPEGELLVVVQELLRTSVHDLDAEPIFRAIRRSIADNHGLQTHAVVLVKPSALPRTTSGKIRRKTCRAAFIGDSLDPVAAWTAPTSPTHQAEAIPTAEQEEATVRADRLIDWLRRHAADSVSACSGGDDTLSVAALFRIFGKQGLLALQTEPEHGGSGLGYFDSARILEQLAAIDFGVSLLVGLNHYLGIQPIARFANPRIRALLLPGLAHGEEFAAFALVEPNGGNGSGTTLSTRAVADEGSRFQLFGTKYLHCVTHGASVINVFARHDDPASISAFVLPENSEGLRQIQGGVPAGILGFTQDTLVLDGVRVGDEVLLGSRGAGMDIARESMLHARLAIATTCIGGMKRCAQFINRRGPYYGIIEGKRTPNPVTLSRLGSVTARITALECLVHRVARAIDAGRKVPPEAFAACRVLGPELLLRSVDDLMQLGITGTQAESHRLACLYRDAGLLRNFDGPPEAVAELTGGFVMEGDGSLRRLLEEVFDAPDVGRWIDVVVATVRQRMATLKGALARRPQRWGHTRAGELSTWLALLAAVDGSRRDSPSAELDHAYAWAHAQFEYALSAVRFGTPSEMAAVDASDIAATFAAYSRAIGELDEGPPATGNAPGAAASWAGLVAGAPLKRDEAKAEAPVVFGESPTVTLSKRELKEWIAKWLADRLRLPVAAVNGSRSFSDHGLDSVGAIELAMELSHKLGCQLDEALLWNFSTIDAMIEWSFDRSPRADAPFDLDAVLDRDIQPSASAPPAEPAAALLTGATGFLGAYLLHELLAQTGAHVYCLVRASDAAAGGERIVKNLRRYGLWSDDLAGRITPVPGNLAEARLGLDPATYGRLADTIDAVYNNGALLSFVAGYEDLKPSHVAATREMLRFASRGRPKSVHHVSSVAVYDATAYRGLAVSETTPPTESRGIHLPYSQCKWVSETLVWTAVARGFPVTIHRPSFIGGSSASGAWNTADFLCRMLKAIVEMNAMPGDLDLDLQFSPVDYVSRSIVYLSRQPSSIGRAFHLQNARGLPLPAFGELLRSFGYDVAEIPYWDWVKRVEQHTAGPLYPLLPFLRHRWLPENLSYVELGQRQLRASIKTDDTVHSLAPAGIECPAIDERLIRGYLNYLSGIDFIAPPKGSR